LVATAALFMVAVGSVFVLRRDATSTAAQPPADGADPPIAAWKLRAMDGVPSGLFKPAFSPVNELLVAVTADAETGIHSLFLIDPGMAEPLQLTRDIEVRGPDPVFSADGNRIWFTTYYHDDRAGLVPDVMEIPVVGGTPLPLIARASAASPHPEGQRFAAAVVTDDGTVIEVVEDRERRRIADHGFWPRWSPDGQWIAFSTSNPEGGNGHLFVIRPDGSDRRQLTTAPTQMYGLCWSPDSERVIFTSDSRGSMNLWMVGVDGGHLEPVTRGPGSFSSPSFSRRRPQLVFAYSLIDDSILIADSPAAPVSVIARESDFFTSALSPDGRHVALVAEGPSRTPSLSVVEIASGRRREVCDLRCGWTSWAPDGQSLIVTAPSPDESARWIWNVPFDGGPPRPLTTGAAHWRWPAISPDGRRLAAAREGPQGQELVVRNLETEAERLLGSFPVIEAIRWSPDGQLIAWSGDKRPADAASSGIWVMSPDGDKPRRLAPDGAWPLWEPAGEGLIFARFLDHDGLWRVPLWGGAPERLRGAFEPDGLLLEGLDIARSGGPVLFHVTSDRSGLYVLEKP